jgi:GAF domain-containing protein/ABC-type amino acid transport substrate-binding protein
VDYLNHLAGQFGFKVEYVTGFPWSEALEGVKHQVVNDLLLTVTHTPEQEKYLAFSGDYLFFPWVIFTRTNSDFLSQLSDLNGQLVSVERNYAAHHFLQAHYPQINLMVVETTEQALEALATSQVAAYVGNLGAGSYIIQQRGFSNLKVAAPAPEGNHNLAMGVRADWPELAGIITRGLNAMTPEEHAKIRQRWLPVRYDYQLDRSELWQWLLIIGVFSGLVFGGVLLWNRSLQVEVKQRTATELALYRRVQELSMLNRITQSLATVTNLDTVLNQVSRRVAEMFEAEFCTINLLNQTGLGMEVVAYYHRDARNKIYSGAVFPVQNNAADQYILDTGRYLLLPAEKFNILSPGSLQKLQEQHIQTLLILPILTRNQVIGTISIGLSRPDRFFSAAEIELLETTAGQIAAALENSRLFEQEQRQRRMAESLRQVALVLSQSLNFSDVIDRILEQLHQVIGFDSAGLFLKEGNALRLTSGYGLDMDIMGFEIPLDSDIISTAVFKERKPQIIGDVSREPRWLILSAARHIKSWMGAPLLVGDAAIGVLTLDSFSYNTYQPDDTQMLQAFANQAAIAIENARQVQRTEQSLRVTQFLYFISNLLAKATNLNAAIEEALGVFLQALHLEQGGISIFEPDMQSAHMYALYQNGRLQPVDSQENMLAGVYDYLIQTRQPLAIFDALHHPLMQDSRELTLARHIQSILFVPLIARGNLIGLLGADSTQSPRHFTDEEVELAQTVADLLATAIENAQLFEKEQQQRQVAESLREVVAILSTIWTRIRFCLKFWSC